MAEHSHGDDLQRWLSDQQALIRFADMNLTGRNLYRAKVRQIGRWLWEIEISCHDPQEFWEDGRPMLAISWEGPTRWAFGERRARRKAARLVRREQFRDPARRLRG